MADTTEFYCHEHDEPYTVEYGIEEAEPTIPGSGGVEWAGVIEQPACGCPTPNEEELIPMVNEKLHDEQEHPEDYI